MMTHKYEIKYLIEAEVAAKKMEEHKKKLIEINRQKAQLMLRTILDAQVAYTRSNIS
jgi:hypothetical protein